MVLSDGGITPVNAIERDVAMCMKTIFLLVLMVAGFNADLAAERMKVTGQLVDDQANPVEGSFEKPYSATAKITRGGGYEFDEDESLVFRRDGATPNVRLPDIGFRLVMIGK